MHNRIGSLEEQEGQSPKTKDSIPPKDEFKFSVDENLAENINLLEILVEIGTNIYLVATASFALMIADRLTGSLEKGNEKLIRLEI